MKYFYVVGLGNPGDEYVYTRHNAGFMCVDILAKELDLSWKFEKHFDAEIAQDLQQGIILIKPQTFMNASGRAVRSVLSYYEKDLDFVEGEQLQKLVICYDDLDIIFGEYKKQFAKHPKVHHGLDSILETLHTDRWWNIRLGTDMRSPENRIKGFDYVLQPFSLQERQQLETLLKTVSAEILQIRDSRE